MYIFSLHCIYIKINFLILALSDQFKGAQALECFCSHCLPCNRSGYSAEIICNEGQTHFAYCHGIGQFYRR